MLQARNWARRSHGEGVLRTRSYCAALSPSFAILLALVFSSAAQSQMYSREDRSPSLLQVRVNPKPIRVPVIDGNDISFTRLSTKAGLSQTRVTHIVQDDRGFVWFGTQYGLNRYDGYEFKVFTPDPLQPNSLAEAYIRSLFKDRAGMLWIGSERYLDRFDPTTETFTHYRLEPTDENRPPVSVEHFSQDRSGILWLATGNGLYGLDPGTGRIIQHYFHDPLNPLSLSSNRVTATGEDRGGRFWVADGSALEQLDRKTGRVRLRVTLASSPFNFSFYEDGSGVLWICYAGGTELAALDPELRELTYYSLYDQKSKKALPASVYAMLQDQNGVLWLGTMGAGLVKFDRAHRTAIRYHNHASQSDSLAEDRVIALTQGREGNIWVGFHATAPNLFAPKSPAFRPLPIENLSPNSLGERFVNAIYEDRRGALWVATTGAIIRIDRKTGAYRAYPPPGPGFDNDVVAITEDRSGTMWVGTVGQGLNRFDPATGRYKAYLHDPSDSSSLSNDVVLALLVDHTGTIWATTWDGLNRFDPATGRFVVFKRDWQSGLENYYDILEDKDGALWLGGNSGLQRFDPQTGKFTGYQHKIDDPNSLSDNHVCAVYIDQSGVVWAGTQSGLDKLDRLRGTFTRYYVRDGLPSNRLNSILGDRFGHMWISTTAGVSEYDPRTNTFTNYLPGMDLTGWAGFFKSQTGEMFFGGFSGGISFYPEETVDSGSLPPVVFTDFRLAGVSVSVGGNSPLKQSISYAQDLTLSHTQTMFEIEFAALSYSNAEMNRYRYKLEGLDSEWHEVGSDRRVATYTTLPPAKYTFHVQSATKQGTWGEPGTALSIRILPPWWATTWFRLALVAALLSLLAGLYRLRLRQMATRFNLTLDARVAERTRIARDLHDTLLQTFQGLLLQFRAFSYQLPDPSEFRTKLENLIDKARAAVTEGRDAVQGLRASTVVGNDLAQSINALGEELAADPTVSHAPAFQVLVEGTPRSLVPILRDEVYQIAGEAMRNAFRHAHAKRIEVEIEYGERQLCLRVRDDGKGIDPKIEEEGGRAGHYGIPGMRERAKLIGADLDVWSEIQSGTEIELAVPGMIAYAKQPAAPRSGFSHKEV